MKIYFYSGNGYYIGSVVIVAAQSKVAAMRLIRQKLDTVGLSNETFKAEDVTEIKIDNPTVIYCDNGDY